MNADIITAILSGLVALVTAVGATWAISRNNRSSLIDDMDQIRLAVIEDNKQLRSEVQKMRVEMELTLAGLVHWRHVAHDGRKAWVVQFGADPNWYREFPSQDLGE